MWGVRCSVCGDGRSSRGSVFLLAMVSLVVLLILGTSLVQTAMQGLKWASDDRRQMEALSLAEAGVEMAITKLYEDYDNINDTLASTGQYSDTFSLAQGSVAYAVTAPYSGIADTCLIVSEATTWTNRRARIRLVAAYQRDVSRIFEGAIFSDSALRLKGAGSIQPDENGLGGDIYSNGDISFDGTSFTMTADGSIYTTGTVSWVPPEVPATNVHQGVAPLTMPTIDIDYYRSIATETYTGKVTFNDSNMEALSGVIFVKGDVDISGSYTGQAIIVATGKIKVSGNVTAGNPDNDTVVLMSPKMIKITGNSHIDGLIYAHSILSPAATEMSGNISIRGAIIADVVRAVGSITITYDDVWKGLPLPGIGKQQWAPISWEEFYL